MMHVFIPLAVAMVVPQESTQESTQESPQESTLASAMEDYLASSRATEVKSDPELRAAHQQARATLPTFVKRLQRQHPIDLEYSLKVAVVRGHREVVAWLSPVSVTRKGEFVGVVDFVVARSPVLQVGERLAVTPEQVLDWVIIEQTLTGEEMVGGFTVRLLEEREKRGVIPYANLPQ